MAAGENVQNRRALLVEDDAATRSVIARHLRRSGLDVTAVESGEQVLLDAGRDGVYDVVISDVHLPGMSGLDLASLILSRNPNQPIVLVTGDPDEALAREALARGPISYLLKPFEMFELDAAVKQALVRQDLARGWGMLPAPGDAGRVPDSWLELVDQRSYAGPGHARRVGRIALALAELAPGTAGTLDVGELLVAAWSHELGRLSGDAADPVRVSGEGARLLGELGCAAGVVDGVRHIHERWDGTGGPGGRSAAAIPAVSLFLAVADSIDHYVSAWTQAGKDPAEAVDRALGLIRVQRGTVFSPEVADASVRQRSRLVGICGEAAPAPVTVIAPMATSRPVPS